MKLLGGDILLGSITAWLRLNSELVSKEDTFIKGIGWGCVFSLIYEFIFIIDKENN